MKATITYIRLRSISKLPAFFSSVMKIMRQLKATDNVQVKTRGMTTVHHTMTLWNNEKDLKSFSSSGAHMEAIRKTKLIAKEYKTVTLDADALPSWKEALKILDDVEAIRMK